MQKLHKIRVDLPSTLSLRGFKKAEAIKKNTPPQTPPARGGAFFDSTLAQDYTDSPSLAEGARGWVDSQNCHLLYFAKSTQNSHRFRQNLGHFYAV